MEVLQEEDGPWDADGSDHLVASSVPFHCTYFKASRLPPRLHVVRVCCWSEWK